MSTSGRGLLGKALAIVALAWAAFGLLLALLIVVPFSNPTLWFFSVVVTEASLLITGFALIGLLLAMVARLSGRHKVSSAAAVLTVVTLVISLMPVAQALWSASREDASLSLSGYFAGLATDAGRAPETVTYARPGGDALKLDVWRPPEQSGGHRSGDKRPAVVVVHGGSWDMGGRSEAPRWDQWLTDQGYVVFDVDYRLAPPPTWRDAPGDVKCAVGWVKKNADRYGVDPDRVALMGPSAGGHLALLAAYTDASLLPPSCDVEDTGVSAVVGFSAPTQLERLYYADPPWYRPVVGSVESLRRFTGGTPTTVADHYRIASPAVHASSDDPPTLLMHGASDQLVPQEQARLLERRLTEAGVEHRTTELAGVDHLFEFNWGGWGSQLARQTLGAFLKRNLDDTARAKTDSR